MKLPGLREKQSQLLLRSGSVFQWSVPRHHVRRWSCRSWYFRWRDHCTCSPPGSGNNGQKVESRRNLTSHEPGKHDLASKCYLRKKDLFLYLLPSPHFLDKTNRKNIKIRPHTIERSTIFQTSETHLVGCSTGGRSCILPA